MFLSVQKFALCNGLYFLLLITLLSMTYSLIFKGVFLYMLVSVSCMLNGELLYFAVTHLVYVYVLHDH